MMIRHKGSVVAAVVLAALVSGGWFLQRETEPAGSVYQQARLFDDVLAHVADYYVDSLDERQLYQMALDGRVEAGPGGEGAARAGRDDGGAVDPAHRRR